MGFVPEFYSVADVAQAVEHFLGKEEVRRFESAHQLQQTFKNAPFVEE